MTMLAVIIVQMLLQIIIPFGTGFGNREEANLDYSSFARRDLSIL